MRRKCGNCALRAVKNGVCPIFNTRMNDESCCPYFSYEAQFCRICGNLIPKGGCFMEENGSFYMMCDDCVTGHPCKSCKEVQGCRFETDQECQEPPYIMTQRRQGSMVVQTQILNPKRIQATCAQGCPCYHDGEDFHCWKQTGCGCNNHNYNWRN